MNKKNTSILIKNAEYVLTINQENKILHKSSIYIEGNCIKEINSKKTKADYIINASGMIIYPGFINCHHHMFQCSLRGYSVLQNQRIDKWIQIVSNAVKNMDEEVIYYSALANMAELILYGGTTTADMMYLFPEKKNGFFEATVKAACDIGIRFHPFRGSMSLSKKDGALYEDNVVEDSDFIADETERLIRMFHNPNSESMLRVGIAPCAIFTNTKQDFLNALNLSEKYKVNLQTHLAESEWENDYALKNYHKRPLTYLQDIGWQGKNVSVCHCIYLTDLELKQLKKTKTHVVHCPISNARAPIDDIGIAPVWEMNKLHINVGLGTDGSAGNDSSNMLEEMRWARTLQGCRKKSTYLNPLKTLQMATIQGANVLNWQDRIGSIEVNKKADLTLFNIQNKIEYAGSASPEWSLISNQAMRASHVIINGRVVVENGNLISMDEKKIITKMRQITSKLTA